MRFAALACLLLASCTKPAGPAAVEPATPLVAETKKALAERDRRLAAYHFVADSKQGDAEGEAHHELFFRAPNKSRGVVTAPAGQEMTLSFDGARFFRQLEAPKKFEVYELKLPADKAAWFLASTFQPFAPEGFRTPLVPLRGVVAKKVAHPRAPDAVELSVATKDESGADITVTYALRLPSGDFLGKRSTVGAQVNELLVEDELCDEKLKLCVPTKLVQKSDGKVVGTTAITKVELNPELPNDSFTLSAPPGFSSEKHELVEAN